MKNLLDFFNIKRSAPTPDSAGVESPSPIPPPSPRPAQSAFPTPEEVAAAIVQQLGIVEVPTSTVDRAQLPAFPQAPGTFQPQQAPGASTAPIVGGQAPTPQGAPTPEPDRPSAYAINYPYFWSQPQTPERRPLSVISLTTMRALADNYPILRACIEHLKREVATVPITIAHRAGDTSEATKARIKKAEQLFTIAGPVGRGGHDPEHFEQAMLEDSLIIGSPAIYHRYSRGGQWLWCDTIDAATIRPVVDSMGWEIEGGLYEQWVSGMKVTNLTARDLSYDKLASVSWQPYSRSPVEWLIHTINTALRVEGWNLTFFTEGSTVADLLAVPEAWSAEQVMTFTTWWNALNTGNTAERLKTKFVPGGTSRLGSHSAKDTDWTPQQLWLLKVTCAVLGVQPASIGFTGDQYKVSQDESMHSTSRFGGGVLLRLRKRRYDDILERAGYGDLHTVLPEEQTEKPKERAEREEVEIRSGARTINEVRNGHQLGAVEGGDETLVLGTLRPLSQALAPPELPSSGPEPIPTPEPGPVPTPGDNNL